MLLKKSLVIGHRLLPLLRGLAELARVSRRICCHFRITCFSTFLGTPWAWCYDAYSFTEPGGSLLETYYFKQWRKKIMITSKTGTESIWETLVISN